VLRVVCASANPHKVAEIMELMSGIVDLEPRPVGMPDVEENADTLEGNARLKALAVSMSTGMPALADDTGLEVAALNGAPGVRTARFAGEPPNDERNRARMLRELDGITDRSARFRTVALLCFPDGREIVAEGVCEGRIAESTHGDQGFGYDSLFVPRDGDGRTFAQMTRTEKQSLSHRGAAFRALATALRHGL
jgi:XTP/dITP diphosphohydrolase